MKIKNLLTVLVVVVTLSVVGIAVPRITQVTADISLDQPESCDTFYWDETENTYGTCTNHHNVSVCSDEPFNTTCIVQERAYYNYTCVTSTKTVQKSEVRCEDKDLMSVTVDKPTGTETYRIDYGDWGLCSYTTEAETLVITCDSKIDGNNDGICRPGESCTQFRITKDNAQRLVKNSRYDFVESDDSFFLEQLNIEEVK